MAWFDTPTIPIGRGQKLTPGWHCFGANTCKINEDTIVRMLMQSRTNLFPVNTHKYDNGILNIGNGNVSWWKMLEYEFVRELIPCLNINLRTSADEAVRVTRSAFYQTGIDLLKLEVLEPDMKVANDSEVIAAAETLCADGYRVMPLITANVDTAKALQDLGCPLVRVQGSPIGSGRGIDNPDAVREVVELGIPVILDCGIGSADHIKQAIMLGCKGFLVDWLLFKDGEPVRAVAELRAELEKFKPWQTGTGSHGDIVDEAWERWFSSPAAA